MTRPIRHGTHGAYDHRRCRCDKCSAFKRQYRQELRLRPREYAEYVDEIAVERACRGQRTGPLNRAEMAAAFAYLNSHGYSSRVIAQLLGVTARTVTRWRTGTVWRPYSQARNTALERSA